jgi:hypothetical protein
VRASTIAAFFISFTISNAFAAESVWTHNGSKIRWESEGQRRTASYLTLRPGLEAAGIQPGAKLFEGARKGAVLSGNSYSFKNGCPPIPFPVSATIANERQIVLTGEAPIRSSGCNTTLSTRTVTLQLDFVPDETEPSQSSPSPRVSDLGSDIPKPSAAVQQKLNALEKQSDDDRRQAEQGSSFTVCNATTEKISVAFGRNGRVRGWTTVHSGNCKLIEKMTSPQRIKYFARTSTSHYQRGVLDLTCIQDEAFTRSDDESWMWGSLRKL